MIGLPPAAAFVGAALFVPAVALLAHETLSPRRAAIASVAIALVGALIVAASPAHAAVAVALVTWSTWARSRDDLAARIAAPVLALAAVALHPFVGIAGAGLASWRTWSHTARVVEAAAAALVLVEREEIPLIARLVGAVVLGTLCAQFVPPVGRIPRRADALAMGRAGLALGVGALVVLDARRGIVDGDDVARALLLAPLGALAGGLALTAILGALMLLAVRDDARLVALAGVGGAITVADLAPAAAALAILPAAVLAAGAGAAYLWLLVERDRRAGVTGVSAGRTEVNIAPANKQPPE